MDFASRRVAALLPASKMGGAGCIHDDTPGAPEIAATVVRTLREAGVTLKALDRS